MADNVELNAGSGGATLRTLDDGSVQWPVGVVAYATTVGTPDVLSIPTAAALADNTANPTTLLQGSCLLVFDGSTWDRARGDSTDGLLVNLGTNNDVSLTGNLPDTAAGDLAAINAALGGTLTVGSHAVTNAGTFAVQESGDALAALQLIDDIIYVDDADWTALTSKHGLIGGIYQSSPGTITDGDTGPLRMTANGAAHVSVQNTVTTSLTGNLPDTAAGDLSNAAAALKVIDNFVYTGNASMLGHGCIGAVYDDTAPGTVTENQTNSLRMSAERYLYTEIRDAAGNERGMVVDASGYITANINGTVTVSATQLDIDSLNKDDDEVLFWANTAKDGTGTDYVPLVDTDGHLQVDVLSGGGGGTQYTEDDAAAANPVGTQPVMVRQDTPAAIVSLDGDVIAQRATNYGAAYCQILDSSGNFINSFGGSGGTSHSDDAAFSIGSASSITPTGYLADETTPDSVDEGDVGVPRMTLSRKPYAVITDGTSENNAGVDASGHLQVDIAADSVGIGGGTQYTAGTDTYAEATTVVTAAGAVRNDTLAALVNTDNEIAPLQVNASGALYIQEGAALDVSAATVTVSATQLDIDSLNKDDDEVLMWANTAKDGTGTDYVPLVDADGHLQVDVLADATAVANTISTNNSTTTPLGISGTFVGTADDVSSYSSVTITLYADVASATDGMKFQFSSDNSNWDDTYSFTMAAGETRRFQLPVTAQYFRLNYTNGGTGQSAFRVQTICHRNNVLTSIHRIEDNVSTDRSATLVKSAIVAQVNGSGDFIPVQATASGILKVGGSLEVDTWSAGTLTVDSELPAAAALADDTANPTVPAVGSFGMVWDGATWDRMAGTSADGVLVNLGSNNDVTISSGTVTTVTTVTTCSTVTTLTGSGVAHDSADSGNPHKIGAKAETSLSGITLVADGDRTDLHAGVDGVLITRNHCNLEDIVSEVDTNTDGASTAFGTGLAAPGAGIKLYITSVTICNSSATDITLDLRDGAAGSVIWTFPVPAGGGVTHTFDPPLPLTANTALAYDASAAVSTVTISALGFKSKV